MLKERQDFQHVYKKGKTFANHFLVLYVLETEELAGRVGFAAGKKLGCAVVRNRVKRLLRECYRLHQPELRAGLALILVGRKPVTEASCQETEKAFLAIGKRAGIFREGASLKRLVGRS